MDAIVVLVIIVVLQIGCSSAATGEQSARIVNSPVKAALALSTYTGGSEVDTIRDIATDSQGNIFITGGTASPNFPVTQDSFDTSFNGWHDVFVAKVGSSGSLVWSTFLGGPNYDRAYAIEVDSTGVYVAGRAGMGLPTTAGAIQRTFGGDANPSNLYGAQDGFISKLSLDGSTLLWSTYFGGNDSSFFRDIVVDGSGYVYGVLADVSVTNPHITAGAFQTNLRGGTDGVITKITGTGSSVVWATYLGGSGNDLVGPSIRVLNGEVYVAGLTQSSDIPTTTGAYDRTFNGGGDVYLAKLSSNGSSLVYATYFGGSALDGTETHNLAVDSAGNAYLGLTTLSTTLPTTTDAFQSSYGGSGGSRKGKGSNYPGDGYIGKISAEGSQLLAGSYLGGTYGEGIEGIVVDAAGDVYLSGATYSNDFPITSGAIQRGIRGGADLFAAKMSGDLKQLIYSTYLGGRTEDFGRTAVIDSLGNFYAAGMSNSPDWPINGPFQTSYAGEVDGVLAKLKLTQSGPSSLPAASPRRE